MLTVAILFLVIQCSFCVVLGCKSSTWREMSMEELLLKSDIVVYGEDREHRKLRNPDELDSRFDVYCVIKTGAYQVPGQVIIENIDSDDDQCSGVNKQTEVGKTYILGLKRTFSGYMKYAEVNSLQKTAFSSTTENLEKVIAICGLDQWTSPKTGEQDGCPAVAKPRFCTKIRDPNASHSSLSQVSTAFLMSVTFFSSYFNYTY